ncbi:prephenate dehydrogenase [Gorillibacterium sp. CAU 1737]|uniref:prephenate dehydrogenase n=1 Tax=Gorillibacterium sp. CAU 1737 TaxID=3140362 RepID=UPI0032618939
MVKKIAIFGVGLMGGSLALCFKGKPGLHVVGHSPNPASAAKYAERGVVDEATVDFEAAAANADFIFLCVPVGLLTEYLDQLGRMRLKPGCIITDVGSTKAEVCRAATKVDLGEAWFIGGHPMAGSERSGVEAASIDLYENAFYIVTPLPGVPEEVVAQLEELLALTRAQVVRVEAEEHDAIVGGISHLPHIVAVALVNLIAKHNEENGLYHSLAAGGFRDITRIAASEPVVWRDILLSNRQVVLELLQEWISESKKFVELLEQEDGDGIIDEFSRSRAFRNSIPDRRKGALKGWFDLYVDVPDHPGIIGHIASRLGEERINLRNIQVIESRADAPGVLRLSFDHQEAQDRAEALLGQSYAVHK